MGVTKSENFTERQNELAAFAKAVGHPARIAIIEFLLRVPRCICGDIVNELPLAQPTVSQHLKELKSAGVIKGNIEGTAVCYCLDTERLGAILRRFNELFQENSASTNSCC
jgi:DNA-binding transcriptional ArsR family regulator